MARKATTDANTDKRDADRIAELEARVRELEQRLDRITS